MGRKASVTKEQILNAAYELLEESGYVNVNIKTVAARVGCSTQPVSWHFGSMPELRKELFQFCANRMWGGIDRRIEGKEAIEAFFETGKNFISIAYDHPNVFRFLYVDDYGFYEGKEIDPVSDIGDPKIVSMIAGKYNVSEEVIAPIVRDIVIYTYGLSTIAMLKGMVIDKEVAYEMIYNEGLQKMKAIGIDIGEMK